MNLRDILTRLRELRWTVKRTSSRHFLAIAPHGARVVIAGTPSDWRSLRNSVARLRREGAEL